ncbi:MAG: DUF4296 domain-containing protein [Bacteroidetes bacterium]|nr:DUF4296 domain-containing protein [Bacteroidota bacterium]MBL6962331.1 DUF4296 domain-containing protein [Bacteroidota bacterium]
MSCGNNKKIRVPADVIPQDELVHMLIDIHLSEASVSLARLKKDSFNFYLGNYYYAIFTKYHVSKEDFEKSMEFYLENPVILQGIYENVIDSLNNLQLVPK